MKTYGKPTEEQKDSSRIIGSKRNGKVQYWRNGLMLTAEMTPETARGIVEIGQAYVMDSHAIGALRDGERAN